MKLRIKKEYREAIINEVNQQLKDFEGWQIEREFLPDIIEIIYVGILEGKHKSNKFNSKKFVHEWMYNIINNWDGLEYFSKLDSLSI